jgi:hypothetical protein
MERSQGDPADVSRMHATRNTAHARSSLRCCGDLRYGARPNDEDGDTEEDAARPAPRPAGFPLDAAASAADGGGGDDPETPSALSSPDSMSIVMRPWRWSCWYSE